jgi:hypothetical protein
LGRSKKSAAFTAALFGDSRPQFHAIYPKTEAVIPKQRHFNHRWTQMNTDSITGPATSQSKRHECSSSSGSVFICVHLWLKIRCLRSRKKQKAPGTDAGGLDSRESVSPAAYFLNIGPFGLLSDRM